MYSISYILYICFIKNQIYSHRFTFSCLILHGSVFLFCFAFNLRRMLILMPCLVIQIEACFPHAASCLPTNPAVGGHWRSPDYRKQSRIPCHVSLSNPRGSFPTTAILRASFIYRKHLLLYCRFLSFPFQIILKEFTIEQVGGSFQLPLLTDQRESSPSDQTFILNSL